jgi:hypothetical protein
MRNGLKLSHLFVLMTLVVGLFGHGSAIAQQGSFLHSSPQAAHDMASHHAHCGAPGGCVAAEHGEACCVLGHCLIGIPVAGPDVAAVERLGAPEIGLPSHMSVWAPASPDPPPRLV